MIQTEAAERVAAAVRRWVKATKVPIYDPKTGTGVIRHVIVRTAVGSGEVMVTLVAADRRLPDTELLLKDITKMLNALSEDINRAANKAGEEEEDYGFYLESLILNVNKKKTWKSRAATASRLQENPRSRTICSVWNLKYRRFPSIRSTRSRRKSFIRLPQSMRICRAVRPFSIFTAASARSDCCFPPRPEESSASSRSNRPCLTQTATP